MKKNLTVMTLLFVCSFFIASSVLDGFAVQAHMGSGLECNDLSNCGPGTGCSPEKGIPTGCRLDCEEPAEDVHCGDAR